MEITVNVKLGLAPRLESFLERVLRELTGEELTGEESSEKPELSELAESSGKAEIPEEPEVEEAEIPEEPEKVIPPTDEEMRTLMDIEISRITGDTGWKESQDPRVKSLRRGCTACFKEIAKRLGAEKPTALEGEKRLQFVEHIKEIAVTGDTCEVLPF